MLLEEMEEIYTSLSINSQLSLGPSYSYLDYALSQRASCEQGRVSTEAQYWEKQLSDLIPQAHLPPDKLPPPILSGSGQLLLVTDFTFDSGHILLYI